MDEEHTPETIINFNRYSYLFNYFFIYFSVYVMYSSYYDFIY